MAHEFESGMLVRRSAWHGLGTVVQEAPTCEEAIRLAGLDWHVDEEPIYLVDGQQIPSRKALVRESDRRVLGVVGSGYRPLQNSEAFSFFNPLLADGDASLETAGSLRKGQRIWILARINGAEADVVAGDPIKGYLLLSNSHDGTLAVRVAFTMIRVVCNNTLTAAHEEGKTCIRMLHRSGLDRALEIVRKSVDLARQTFSFSLESYREMTRHQLPVEGFREYVRSVWQIPEDEPRVPDSYEELEALFDAGTGNAGRGVSGTVYAAYNAVTEWIDHRRGTSGRGRRSTPDSRLDSSWFGPSAAIRDRAYEEAVALTR